MAIPSVTADQFDICGGFALRKLTACRRVFEIKFPTFAAYYALHMALLRQTHRCLLHQHRNFSASAVSQTWFGNVEQAPKDPILGISEAFLADEKPNKMNLGVVWLQPCMLTDDTDLVHITM